MTDTESYFYFYCIKVLHLSEVLCRILDDKYCPELYTSYFIVLVRQ